MTRIALIGFGYWGPNMARNISNSQTTQLIAVVDRSESRRAVARAAYPNALVCGEIQELNPEEIDAVIIATPANSHFELTRFFLELHKHVLVEKPLATNLDQARKLVNLAKKSDCVLMVDHTYLFSDSVALMKESVDRGELGELVCFDSTRINLGIFQPDVSVVWDLAVHDVAILSYITGMKPNSVSATAQVHPLTKHPAVSSLSIDYAGRFSARILVSWLSPVKVRRTCLTGVDQTIVFDDSLSDEKIKIYESGVEAVIAEEGMGALVKYRLGNIRIPRLPGTEALKREIEQFVFAIEQKINPVSSGLFALEVISILEAAHESIMQGGASVAVRYS